MGLPNWHRKAAQFSTSSIEHGNEIENKSQLRCLLRREPGVLEVPGASSCLVEERGLNKEEEATHPIGKDLRQEGLQAPRAGLPCRSRVD